MSGTLPCCLQTYNWYNHGPSFTLPTIYLHQRAYKQYFLYRKHTECLTVLRFQVKVKFNFGCLPQMLILHVALPFTLQWELFLTNFMTNMNNRDTNIWHHLASEFYNFISFTVFVLDGSYKLGAWIFCRKVYEIFNIELISLGNTNKVSSLNYSQRKIRVFWSIK